MRIVVFLKLTVPPLLEPDGSLTHDPKVKASLLADVFDQKTE